MLISIIKVMNSTVTSQFPLVKPKYDIGKLFSEWLYSTAALFRWAGNQILESRPFSYFIYTENGMSVAKEKSIIRGTEQALKYGKRHNDVDDMFKDILGEKKYQEMMS